MPKERKTTKRKVKDLQADKGTSEKVKGGGVGPMRMASPSRMIERVMDKFRVR